MATTSDYQKLTETLRMGRKLHEAANILARIEQFLEENSYDVAVAADPDAEWDQRNYVSVSFSYGTLSFGCAGPNAAQLMVGVRRAIGGLWEKHAYGDSFQLHRYTDYSGLRLEITASRDAVCEKTTVKKEVKVPAREADPDRAARLRKQARELQAQAKALMEDQPEHVEEQDVDEWECQPVLKD